MKEAGFFTASSPPSQPSCHSLPFALDTAYTRRFTGGVLTFIRRAPALPTSRGSVSVGSSWVGRLVLNYLFYTHIPYPYPVSPLGETSEIVQNSLQTKGVCEHTVTI